MSDTPSWIIALFATFSAAFFGYLMAVKKFKKETFWQEKYKMYQDILTSLEAMLIWANETYCHNKMIPTIGLKTLEKDKLISFAEARRNIAKISCIGQLIISDDVITELNLLQSELWNEDFRAEDEIYNPDTIEETEAIAEHVELIRKIVEPRLKKIIMYAKIDLA